MKKALCCLMVLFLSAALMPYAQVKAAERPRVLKYDELTRLVVAGNVAYQKDLQEIRRLELSYDDISQQHWEVAMQLWDLPDVPGMESQRAQLEKSEESLYNNVLTTRNRINDLKKALDNRAIMHVFPAQSMYVRHYMLLIELELANSELETLERDLEYCRLKAPRGLVSDRDLRNAKRKVDDQKDVKSQTGFD